MTLRSHEIMISQGKSWATVKIRDKGEDIGKSAWGTWNAETDQTSDDSTVSFTSASPTHLAWRWTSDPGTLLIGEKWDQSQSSYKEGEGEFTDDILTLLKARRAADGKFSSSGSGWLKRGVGNLFKMGNIEWEVVRYER